MATERDLLISEVFFKAAFPVMKVVLEDDPKMAKKFEGVSAVVQIGAKLEDGGVYAARLIFEDGKLTVAQGAAEEGEPVDLNIEFPSIECMNKMFQGGMDGKIIGTILKSGCKKLGKFGLFMKVLGLLMSLMLMMPNKVPTDPAKRALKVKMSLYMVTTALSTWNKKGNNDLSDWTANQPDRIYQFTIGDVEAPEIACYFRVKAGKSKAGRGIYERRRPFVHFSFPNVDGAMKVLLKQVEFVSGVEEGCVEIIGSPEYASALNNFMTIIQGMLVGK